MKHWWFSLSLLYLAADFFSKWIGFMNFLTRYDYDNSSSWKIKAVFCVTINYYVLNYSQFWCNLNLLSIFWKMRNSRMFEVNYVRYDRKWKVLQSMKWYFRVLKYKEWNKRNKKRFGGQHPERVRLFVCNFVITGLEI